MSDQSFVILQCTDSDCRFRFPKIDVKLNDDPCPLCGKPTVLELPSFSNLPLRSMNNLKTQIRVRGFLDNLRSAYNVGSIFRTASGASIDHLYLSGMTPTAAHPKVAKTSLGAERQVSWSSHNNSMDLAQELISKGHYLVALESGAQSEWLTDLAPIKDYEAVTLIVGNELSGIDPALLAISHQIAALPMLGSKTSLNVTVAFGIAAYYLKFLFQSDSTDEG
jgi:23S rRNA (guanosine2251-2'-O)-methyltransferase